MAPISCACAAPPAKSASVARRSLTASPRRGIPRVMQARGRAAAPGRAWPISRLGAAPRREGRAACLPRAVFGGPAGGGPLAGLPADLRSVAGAARRALRWDPVLLGGLLLFAALWIGAAVLYYPPRGVDDVYHLPPVYQAVQDH